MLQRPFIACLILFLLFGLKSKEQVSLDGKTFFIINAANNRCLDVFQYGKENGSIIKLWTRTSAPNQQWKFIDAGNGNYVIHGIESNKCLDADGGTLQTNGTKIQIWDCHNGTNQQWRFVPLSNGKYIIHCVANNKCLDAETRTLYADGTKMQLSDCYNSLNQQWTLEEYKTVSAPSQQAPVLSGKTFTIKNVANNKCLDVFQYGKQNGSDVKLWTRTNAPNQQWKFIDAGNGNYVIHGIESDKCLDADGGTLQANGTKIQIWDCHNGANQQWKLIPAGNGNYIIHSAANDKCLDADAGTLNIDGTKMQLWDCHNGPNQQWIIEEYNNASSVSAPPSPTVTVSPTGTGQTPNPINGQTIPAAPDDGITYEDVPDMPQSDIDAVMKWIKNKTTGEKLPFCWRQSYIENPNPLTDCPPGKQKHLALCYPRCRDGYEIRLDRCWQTGCPSGFKDDGLTTCWKPLDYGRGAGRIPDVSCPPGTPHQRGIGAAAWCDNFGSIPLKTSKATIGCRGDEEYTGGLCYPKCRPGYTKTTNNFCTAICPPNMSNSGAGCLKDNYYNTAGTPLVCGPGLIQDGALCYKACKQGYHMVAGVCWQNCDPGWTECAAGCSKTSLDCGMAITDQVISVLTLAVNIATLGMAEPATAGVKAASETVKIGTKVVTGTSKVGKSLVKFVSKIKNSAVVKKTIAIKKRVYNEKTKQVVETVSTTKDVYDMASGIQTLADDFFNDFAEDFAEQTSPEINSEIDRQFGPKTANYLKKYWGNIQLVQMAGADGFQIAQDVLSLVSIVDPTGVVGVVSAFTKPICQDVIQFPTLSKTYK
ncbi:MAG: RICIN domain-containing protein [Ferruginibacter sp.]